MFFHCFEFFCFKDGTTKVYDAQLEGLASKWVNEYYEDPVPFREPETVGPNHEITQSDGDLEAHCLKSDRSGGSSVGNIPDSLTF